MLGLACRLYVPTHNSRLLCDSNAQALIRWLEASSNAQLAMAARTRTRCAGGIDANPCHSCSIHLLYACLMASGEGGPTTLFKPMSVVAFSIPVPTLDLRRV